MSMTITQAIVEPTQAGPRTEATVRSRPEPLVAIDPLEHPAWDSVVATHPQSSFFHGRAWACVVQGTYGHRPVYFCRFAGGFLAQLLPIMEVSSLWTGRRGVSLPFTDFCLPLRDEQGDEEASSPRPSPPREEREKTRLPLEAPHPGPLPRAQREEDIRQLYELALKRGRARSWRYLECRGSDCDWPTAKPSLAFYGHVLDLVPGPERLFKQLDGPVRRGIRKAQEAKLRVEFRNGLESIRIFYALHCRTRHRHGLPPQPFRFFENIARYVLEPGHGFVAITWLEQRALAAAVFFHNDRQAIYKFGASDYSFQQLRPNNLLMWEAIKRCAVKGFESLHLGRTSLANEGLRRFKLGFGAREERIQYYKFDFVKQAFVTDTDRAEGWFNRVFRCLPPRVLRLAGQVIYPHLS